MNQDTSKAIALAAIFTLLFVFFAQQFTIGGDYDRHFFKAKNGCVDAESVNWKEDDCNKYAPLFHILASPFTFHPSAFFFFSMLIITFITPIILFLITRNWLIVWFYYSISSYTWFFTEGFLPQALANVFLLLIFYFKDWRIQGLIVLLSMFAHGHGFFLALSGFISIHLWYAIKDYVKDFDFKEKFSKIMLGCSGIFGLNKPEIFNTQIDGLVNTGDKFTVSDFLILFVKIFPLPFMFLAVKELWDSREDWHYLFMAVIAFIVGLFVSHRAFYIIPLMLLPSLTSFVSKLDTRNRHLFLLVSLFVFLFQVYSWANIKIGCRA